MAADRCIVLAVSLSAVLGVLLLTSLCRSSSSSASVCSSRPSWHQVTATWEQQKSLLHPGAHQASSLTLTSTSTSPGLQRTVPTTPPARSTSVLPASSQETTASTSAVSSVQAVPQGDRKCVASRLGQGSVLPNYHEGWTDVHDKEYPLRDEILPEGFIKGDVSRMQKVLDKLLTGQPVVVVIIGGSFTKGMGCHDTLNRVERNCNWNSRVMRWFKHAFPKANIDWHDESQGATPSLQFLSGLGAMLGTYQALPDLVILDTLINDAGWPKYGIEGGKINSITGDEAMGAGFEKLLMSLQEIAPAAQLLVVQDGCARCIERMHLQKTVTMHHNIPIVDYAALTAKYNYATPGQYGKIPKAPPRGSKEGPPTRLWIREAYKQWYKGVIWPNFVPRTEQLSRVPYPEDHPNWVVHQYVADTVVYSLRMMLEDACEGNERTKMPPVTSTYWKKESLNKFPACKAPSSYYSARRAFLKDASQPSLKPTVVKGDWKLFEDRPGKAGWIGTRPGSVLEFPVKTSSLGGGAISVSYLTSYEGVGVCLLEAFIPGAENTKGAIFLRGKVEKFSQVKTDFFSSYHGHLLTKLPKSETNIRQIMLRFTIPATMPRGTKFKIVEVTSC
eukprot:TRINITY_DN6015_c0_g1_i2.p1 TRINITY_DN6015_c0_g1~~TRINITY_DN6015_c0_g1_i2.p1  ORF type:complete len:616 (-),score=69.00 TRINITY_DN6015_c0_g1_i2:894-2741(-)